MAARKPVGELLDAVLRQPKIKRSAYQVYGRFPIVDQSQAAIAGYTDDESWLYTGKLPVVVFGDHTRVLKFVDFPFCVGADGTQLLRPVAGNDIRYFYYALRNVDLANYGYERHFKYLKEEEIEVLPLSVQQRIASILSAYDELIETNQRRIRILENMARSLYREWFVHFRYPGHESVPLVDSSLGQIPQGWEVKKLGDIAVVNRTQINAKTAPDELHYIDIASVSPGQIDYVTTYAFADAPGRARRVVQHGDVLWSCVRPNRRSHALVMHPETNTIASTGFAVLTAKDVPFTFLYFATTTDDFVSYLTNNASGAAYPAVTATTFEKAELLIPSPALLERFGEATIAMAGQAHTLQRQTANLRCTRDLLLPRLLSGQVLLDA